MDVFPGRDDLLYYEMTPTPGAQTKRRGDAGPVRAMLGGVTSPAAFVAPAKRRGRGAKSQGRRARGEARGEVILLGHRPGLAPLSRNGRRVIANGTCHTRTGDVRLTPQAVAAER
jgi:hypothetical protein